MDAIATENEARRPADKDEREARGKILLKWHIVCSGDWADAVRITADALAPAE